MITEFECSVIRTSGSEGPCFQIGTMSGLSLGTSADGSTSVAILGTNGMEQTARKLAQAYARDGRNPTIDGANPVGCVIIDQLSGVVVAVSPPIGLRQIFWRARGDSFGVASRPDALATLAGGSPVIRADSLFSYLYFHMLPGPASVFEGVSKLDGGHWLRWHGSGTDLQRYWRPHFEDRPTLSEPEATRDLHRLLREAVEHSLETDRSVGAFLSGGLDSSTVAGIAARVRPGIPTVSMGFDAEGYDEMEYARVASRHFGTTPLEYYVTPDDVLSTLPTIASAFPEPFGNSSAPAVYHCARIAREHGLELLLAGDGGDELFGGNERYAKQLVFERYGHVPVAFRRALLEPLVVQAARLTRAFPIGKAASYIQQSKVPLPDRLQTYNFLHQITPDQVFSPTLLEQVDIKEPLHLLRTEYNAPETTSAVNRMLFLDWKFTLHDNDLVKVNTMCQLGGVEVAYPMIDPAVVDLSLCLPGDWKVRNGTLRWFYKRAMRDFLPQQIIAKHKHGFGLPFGVWTRSHPGLKRLSEDALMALADRRYFRREFLQRALRLHREGHASYHGEMVWVLMVLELWLQSHAPDAAL